MVAEAESTNVFCGVVTQEAGDHEHLMAGGTDGGDKLSAGRFDEGDSHHSFLEALNAWRQGTRPPEAERRSTAAATTGSNTIGTTNNSSSSSCTTNSSSSNTNTSGSSFNTSTRPQQQGGCRIPLQDMYLTLLNYLSYDSI